eukprot:2117819-Prymnesium_polylepis.1
MAVINLTNASVAFSNLGGFGPDADRPPHILYHSAGRTASGRSIDLQVSVADNYTPRNTAANGLSGEFGTINVDAGSANSFRLTFIDTENGEHVVVDRLVLTVHSITTDWNGEGRETLITCGFSSLAYATDAFLDVTPTGGHETRIVSTAGAGTVQDGRQTSVMFRFAQVSEVVV